MVVREAGANGHVDLEPSRWREEVQLRCFEWIILMKLQQPMIVSSFVRWMKTVQAEVELQVSYPSHEGVLQWITLEFGCFLLETQECKFLSHIAILLSRVAGHITNGAKERALSYIKITVFRPSFRAVGGKFGRCLGNGESRLFGVIFWWRECGPFAPKEGRINQDCFCLG